MRKIILLFCCMFLASAPFPVLADAAADSAAAQEETYDVKLARFFAGVTLIKSTPGLSDTESAARFRELEAVSGVTAKEALEFIKSCGSDPAKWKAVNDLAIPMLMAISENAAAGAAAAAAAAKLQRKKGRL
jgi:hypothetical protein